MHGPSVQSVLTFQVVLIFAIIPSLQSKILCYKVSELVSKPFSNIKMLSLGCVVAKNANKIIF